MIEDEQTYALGKYELEMSPSLHAGARLEIRKVELALKKNTYI
jgi:hypothetical protein